VRLKPEERAVHALHGLIPRNARIELLPGHSYRLPQGLQGFPAVLLGERIAQKLPEKLIHSLVAALFFILGIATLMGLGESLGF